MGMRRGLAILATLATACGAREALDDPAWTAREALPTSCASPFAPVCSTMRPAPTSTPAVERFVKDTAVPLRCGPGVWDVRPIIELFGDRRALLFGEIHGTNEIGIVSAVLFEELALGGHVNALALELPMDTEAALQRWVDAGEESAATQSLRNFAPNFFGRLLTDRARALAARGVPITVAAVDIPSNVSFAASEIERIADKLFAQRGEVLATLPRSHELPPSPADIAKVNAYFDRIIDHRSAICSELSADDCERLVAMTHALWATVLSYDVGGDYVRWSSRREEVIFYNLKTKLAAKGARMFAHLGATHVNKERLSAGHRLAFENSATKGQVFAIGPAFGDGSVIHYSGELTIAGEPATVTAALGDAPVDPLFVSTTRASAECIANPLGLERADVGTRAEAYDGYVHYGRLTSESRPSDTRLSRDSHVLGRSASPLRSQSASVVPNTRWAATIDVGRP